MAIDYTWLLNSPTGEKWKRIGIDKCSGVVVPLFSIYSENSIGIGEYPDLKQIVDWCGKTGIKIIQLLPLNDVGFNFTPYDAQSMFALDPMYLSINVLKEVDLTAVQTQIDNVKTQYPAGTSRVNYDIKKAKLKLLWQIFETVNLKGSLKFQDYTVKNQFWLQDYALYKVLKKTFQQKDWLNWKTPYQHKMTPDTRSNIEEKKSEIQFEKWLQWQAYEQMKDVKFYANAKNVYLMGDLPFLVSKDSADVWANQDYFKLGFAAGAPPDLYFANGQRWGMPPYNWENIAAHQYDYLVEKLQYAQNFYDMYRIDHFVGIFRLWTIPNKVTDHETAGKGFFDPSDKSLWEDHGKKILDIMLKSTTMLPCAEDLGTVPDCSYKVIKEYGIAGTDIQRWMRWWDKNCDFKTTGQYRSNGIAAIATHDLPVLQDWWENELATVDEFVFRKKCQGRGFDIEWLIGQLFYQEKTRTGRLHWREEINDVDKLLGILYKRAEEVGDFINLFICTRFEKEKYLEFLGIAEESIEQFSVNLACKILEKTNECASIFSIQMLQDWLSISPLLKNLDPLAQRINRPGQVSAENWSMIMPFSLEQLNKDASSAIIRDLNKKTNRAV